MMKKNIKIYNKIKLKHSKGNQNETDYRNEAMQGKGRDRYNFFFNIFFLMSFLLEIEKEVDFRVCGQKVNACHHHSVGIGLVHYNNRALMAFPQ